MAHSYFCYICRGDAERRQTFYMHISVVHFSGELTGAAGCLIGEDLFGCCLNCLLLRTALGSVTGTRQWLNQMGHCIVLTGTSSSGEHRAEHQILKHIWFSVRTMGRDPRTNTQTRWLITSTNGRRKEQIVDRNWQNNGEMEDSECKTCWFVADRQCSQPVDLSALTLWP